MIEGGRTRVALAVWTVAIVLFLLVPILIIAVYAFNPSNVQGWPIDGLSTKWFGRTVGDQGMRDALWLSVRAALVATTVALLLGSAAAFGVSRFRFFGREAVSLLVVLPLALPGVVAGSIFTFSLTLGDYITPLLVGGPSSSFIGNVVYGFIGINANIPFAAALAVIPVVIMGVYLTIARRLGAFEAL